jgi:hypothetical protein
MQARLRHVGRRLVAVGVAAGTGWGLVAAVLLLLAGVWLDLLWELPPQVRVACDVGAPVALALLVLAAGYRALRGTVSWALADRLDRVAQSGGVIRTGVDLALESRPLPPLSGGLAALAVRRADEIAGRVSAAAAVPARPAYWSFGGAGLLGAAVGVAALAMPRLTQTEWLRFADPAGDHPPYSRVLYEVEPGDARVVYGSGLDVHVTTSGAPVERVELVLESDGAAAPESLPMFPGAAGEWRAAVAAVTAPGRYFVRSHGGRSRKFRIDVLTVPRLEGVRFRVTPPAYTNLAPYEGPLPQGGLAGLPGTTIQVWARSNRPLSGGSLEVPGDDPAAAVALAPTARGAREATGSFEVRRPGKLRLRVTDTEGQASDPFVTPVAVLTDERPFIRLLQPQAQSLATPEALLPVVLAAEDDYGISRVQLFRSLNDSRALPQEVPVPTPAPTRFGTTLTLPLKDYGLAPGDEIKLYGRVEDNDPAGPKGSESAVAVVRIISQEEFERLLRTKEGMEVFLSKYRQAQRRLEALAEQADRLRKKLKDVPADSEAAEELRRELAALARQMGEQAEAVRKAARQPLPYDLDKALTRHLDDLADRLQRLSRRSESAAAKSKLTAGEMAKLLDEMTRELEGQERGLESEALEPLEYLAAVLPLLEDASRFVILYQRQQALAERLQSLKDRERPDDPSVKGRMRDLEAEQREIRQALGNLLDDIQDHVARLPDDPRMEELRNTATEFFRDVRASGAGEAMAEAEAGLADFSGGRGHAGARKAAGILEKFVKRCEGGQGMMGRGQVCLRFQPCLKEGLGNTVEQLLADAGLMSGGGRGAGGGTSASRSTLDNVGLYGTMPALGETTAGGRSRQGVGGVGRSRQGPATDPARPATVEADRDRRAAGAGDAAVPLPYRGRVAEYFQRIAEETGK